MNAIIARPAAGATRATSASRKSKAKKSAVTVPPMDRAPATPAAEAANWQTRTRAALAQIAGMLDQIEEPAPSWTASDTPTELISHVLRWVHDTLRQKDGEEAWESSNTMWAAILWPFESLRAAVELGSTRGWAASTPEAFALLTTANDQLTALQEYVAAQPVAASRPFQEKPRPPIRREPEAGAADAILMEALAEQAARAGDLVRWCTNAQHILAAISKYASVDEELRNTLEIHDIRYNNADWNNCRMNEGLEYVLLHQSGLIDKMAGGAA